MSVVAITGCSGYIGSRLCMSLCDDERIERVVGVDLMPPVRQPENLLFRRLDVRDNGLGALFREQSVEKVIHLAFVVDPIRDDRLMHEINIGCFENVVSASIECGARHLTVASSTTAFGAFEDNPDWLTEQAPIRRHPDYTYASDKYEIEKTACSLATRHPSLAVALVRPCIIYGPCVDNYLSRFILRLPFIPGVGGARPQMQFVFEEDAVEVFRRVTLGERSGVFHAVGDGLVGLDEIASMAGKRIVDFPAGIIYPSVDLLWRLRAPRIEGPSGMLDFIRYRWTASDAETRAALGLPVHMSSRQVVEVMLKTH